uniref:Vegetative cell wall protein gp1-like n=1 Tax=Diabrotica virgifera virgifera TaxID=50390 RepID=A0A6P7FHE0_DIAVI
MENKGITIIWYVDNAILTAGNEDDLQRLVHKFNIIAKKLNVKRFVKRIFVFHECNAVSSLLTSTISLVSSLLTPTMALGSDASSVIFASTPASRKHEFPGALPPSLPSLSHGTSSSPVPAPTPPNLPVPSPAPAQQPPQHPLQAIPSASVSTTASVVTPSPTPAVAIKPITQDCIESK